MDAGLYTAIKERVIGAIQDLKLPGINNNVLSQLMEDDANVAYPAIVVTREGLTEEMLYGDTRTKDWVLPLAILIVHRGSPMDKTLEARFDQWRKTITDRFWQINRPDIQLNIPACWRVVVEPRMMFDPNWPRYQNVVSGMVMKFWVTEKRG